MITQLITSTKSFKQLEQNFLEHKFTHAHMLICSDSLLLTEFSRALAGLIICKTSDEKNLAFKKITDGAHPDVITIKNEKGIMVEDILQIVSSANVKPLEADSKVYIIENADSINAQAQNKLLKTLEEPPVNVYIILNVSNPASVLNTVASRCSKTNIELLAKQQIYDILKTVGKGLDEARITRAVALCECKVGRAMELAQKDSLLNLYDYAIDIFENMKKSSDVLKYSSHILSSKDDILELLNFMLIIARDMLAINAGATESVIVDQTKILNIANYYSNSALLFIIEKIMNAQKDIDYSCNLAAVIDTVLMSILEGKYRWQKLQA